MKVCKVNISDNLLFDLMGLSPYVHRAVAAECNSVGTITLTIEGEADDIPEVAEGEEIPRRIVEVRKYTSKLVE